MHATDIMPTHTSVQLIIYQFESNSQQWTVELPLSISEFIVGFKAYAINQRCQ